MRIEELKDVFSKDVGREIDEHDQAILNIVGIQGGCIQSYRKSREPAVRNMISELYFPPRITDAAALLHKLEITPGFAVDRTNDWDFNEKSRRDEAVRRVKEEEPQLLVGSLPCTAYCQLQLIYHHKRDPAVVAWETARADVHLAFCAKLYEEQHRHGRYILHEHLAGATSWGEDSIKKVMNMCGVDQVILHQCQVGQDDGKGNPLKKPTRLISNSQHILQQLDRRCAGRGG